MHICRSSMNGCIERHGGCPVKPPSTRCKQTTIAYFQRRATCPRTLPCRASKPDKRSGERDAEEELEELLEATVSSGRTKGTKPLKKVSSQDTVKNGAQQSKWKEGKLLPEGWEKMSGAEKASQLYMGERGFLFWANRLAFASVFVMGGLWVFFRFVGPGLGLYELADTPVPP